MIHTLGMRFPLDVIFINQAWRIVMIRQNIGPWRIIWGGWDAVGAIEMRAGGVSMELERGDELILSRL